MDTSYSLTFNAGDVAACTNVCKSTSTLWESDACVSVLVRARLPDYCDPEPINTHEPSCQICTGLTRRLEVTHVVNT